MPRAAADILATLHKTGTMVAEETGLLDITLDQILASSCTLELDAAIGAAAEVAVQLDVGGKQFSTPLVVERYWRSIRSRRSRRARCRRVFIAVSAMPSLSAASSPDSPSRSRRRITCRCSGDNAAMARCT